MFHFAKNELLKWEVNGILGVPFFYWHYKKERVPALLMQQYDSCVNRNNFKLRVINENIWCTIFSHYERLQRIRIIHVQFKFLFYTSA